MVNVYTNNGQFNISESLMEAIKVNNPELLVEKKFINEENSNAENSFDEAEELSKLINKTWHQSIDDVLQTSELNLSREDYVKLYNYIHNPKNDEYIKDILDVEKRNKNLHLDTLQDEIFNRAEWYAQKVHDEHTKEYIQNLVKKENEIASKAIEYEKQAKEREEERNMRQQGIDDSADQILFQQLLKHGGKIPNKLEVNGEVLTKKDIKARIKKNPYFNKEWEKLTKSQEKEDIEKREELALNAKEIKQQNKLIQKGTRDLEPTTLKDLLKSSAFNQEVDLLEQTARILVQRARKAIPRILGVFGSSSHNDSSYQNKKIKLKQQNIRNNRNDIINNMNDKNAVKELGDKKTTGFAKSVKDWGALALGGFNLVPLFDGNPENKDKFGMAMRYYKEYTQSKNENSLVDNFMDYLILNHSNINTFKEKLISEGTKNEEIPSLIKQMNELGASFLSNVVFRLEIGNDNNFNEILRAIKFSELKEKYIINNESKLHILGAKEQELVFISQTTHAVAGIFVAMPLLAKTKELFKQASNLTRHFRNAKA